MSSFFRIFRFVKPHAHIYVPSVIVFNSSEFLSTLAVSLLLSGVTAAILDGGIRDIINIALLFGGMFLCIMALFGFSMYFYVVSAGRVLMDLKRSVFSYFVKTNIESSMAMHSGERVAIMEEDANKAGGALTDNLSPFLGCIITIVMSAAVIFVVDYRLGFASMVVGGISFFAQSRFVKPLGKLNEERLEAVSSSTREISNIFSGGLAIRALNIKEKAHARFDAENTLLRKLSFRQSFITMWQSMFTTLQGWLTLFTTFALGGWLVATGRLEFPALMMVPQLSLGIATSMTGLGKAWAGLQAPAAAIKRIFKILDAGAESEASDYKEKQLPKNNGYSISIKGLCFNYLNSETKTLSDINLDISENEFVAFVGESGSGKSTLLRTIIGLYSRDDLNIRLGEADFASSSPRNWRKQFAYVDQSCKLFDMTIAENIALGVGGGASLELIKEAAVRASADEFIAALSDGYDSPCGEKGASLSGGQKQRIAIARALAKKAPILVFDEATSALDAESELGVMDTIESLRRDHTILITTHNLNNTVTADKIVVMEAGRIVEAGKHEELMAKKGVYYQLFAKQTP